MSFNSLEYFFEELAATEEIHFTKLFPPKFLVVKTFQLYSTDFLGIRNRLKALQSESICSVKNQLGTQPGFGTQPRYKAPADLRVKFVQTQ